MGAKRDERQIRMKRYANLIERQTGKAVRPFRMDGYANMLNRYGTSKDATEHYFYQPEPAVPDDLITMFYESNGLFSTIIDTPAEEAIKHGFTLEGLSDSKIENFYKEALDELDWEETAMTAIKWARLFGGSIAVLLVNDGRGLEEPLDWRHIQSIDDIRVYDRSVITPDYSSMFSYNPQNDPFGTRGSRLGMPEYYDVSSRHGSFRVHDSRCLVFQNGALPENTSNSNYMYWGVPEYVRIHRAIRDAEIAHGSAVKLLDRSVQPVYKMKDLSAELSTEEGENNVLRRLQVIDMARGMLNTIVIDNDGEEYDFRQFSYSGVSEVINTTCNYLSALTNIPQTILFGRSPAGMNSTGEGDLENFYNYVERIERRMVRKNLRYLLSVIFQAGVATGEIDEVPPIKIKFNPLWSMSEADEIALEQQKIGLQQARAQTAQIYVEMQALDPSEVRKKLADSGEFDVETMLDDYTPEELEANAPKGEGGEGGAPGGGMEGMMPGGPDGGMPPAGGAGAPPEEAPEGPKEPPAGGNAPGKEGKPPDAETPGEEAPEEAPQEGPQPKGKQSRMGDGPGAIIKPEQVSVSEKKGKPEAGGNAPEAAPTATKLPQDMSNREKKDIAENMKAGGNDQPEGKKASADSPFSVIVLVVKDGRILCATRHNDVGYGQIGCPGGHAEPGETPKQAALRETKEEFGIQPKDLIFIGKGSIEKESGLVPHIFLCTEYDGKLECLDAEMVDPKFLSMKDLKGKELFQPFADSLQLLETVLSRKPDAGHYQPEQVEGMVEEMKARRSAKKEPQEPPQEPQEGPASEGKGKIPPAAKGAPVGPVEGKERAENREQAPGGKETGKPVEDKPEAKPPAPVEGKPEAKPKEGQAKGKLPPDLLKGIRDVADAIQKGRKGTGKAPAKGRLTQKEWTAIAEALAMIRGEEPEKPEEPEKADAAQPPLKEQIRDVVSTMKKGRKSRKDGRKRRKKRR